MTAAQSPKQCFTVPGVKRLGPYSPAVRAGGFVFVARQLGVVPASGEPAGADFATQARQAFRNLGAVLQAAGSRFDLVVQTTVLVAGAEYFSELNHIFEEFFPADPPTRMTLCVAIPRGLLLSIGCTALPGD